MKTKLTILSFLSLNVAMAGSQTMFNNYIYQPEMQDVTLKMELESPRAEGVSQVGDQTKSVFKYKLGLALFDRANIFGEYKKRSTLNSESTQTEPTIGMEFLLLSQTKNDSLNLQLNPTFDFKVGNQVNARGSKSYALEIKGSKYFNVNEFGLSLKRSVDLGNGIYSNKTGTSKLETAFIHHASDKLALKAQLGLGLGDSSLYRNDAGIEVFTTEAQSRAIELGATYDLSKSASLFGGIERVKESKTITVSQRSQSLINAFSANEQTLLDGKQESLTSNVLKVGLNINF